MELFADTVKAAKTVGILDREAKDVCRCLEFGFGGLGFRVQGVIEFTSFADRSCCQKVLQIDQ